MINRFTLLILFLSFSLTSIYADNLLEISTDNQLPDFLSNKVIVEGENNSLDNISTDDELLSDPGIKEVNELIEYKAPAYMNVALGVYNRMIGSYSRSWTVALDQYQIFSDSSKGYTSGTIQIWSHVGLKNAIEYQGIQEGDLIYFCGADGNSPHHAAIITSIRDGDIYYNAHSGSRNDEALSTHVLSYVNGKYVKGTEVVVIVKIRDDA